MITNPIIPIWIMVLICIIISVIAKSKNKYSFLRKFIIIILVFTINLRIMISSEGTKIVPSNNLDVLFVVDNTISMLAEDYNGKGQRLTAIKKDCNYIIDKLNGANFSVITFNNSSRVVIPYTKDASLAAEAISTIKVMDEMYAEGSSLNIALDEIIRSLEASDKKEDRNRIIFFISDGEITNNDTLKSFSGAKKNIDNGAVLGYGSSAGGYMRAKDMFSGEEKYIEDTSLNFPYPKAVSKIDENNLKKVANDMGIDYIHMEKQADIDSKLKEITKELVKTTDESQKATVYVDIYYIFAIPLVLLLIYEFINYKRRLVA